MRERRGRTSANETALLPELTGLDSGNGPQQSSSSCATRTLTAMVQSAIGNELAGESQGFLLTPRYTIWRAARLPRGSREPLSYGMCPSWSHKHGMLAQTPLRCVPAAVPRGRVNAGEGFVRCDVYF